MFIYESDGEPFKISHCVTSHVVSDYSENASRHLHEGCELLLFIRGDMNYSINGERYVLRPYDLLFIPSATYHFFIPVSDVPYENYVINFNADFIAKERTSVLFSPPYTVNISEDSKLISMFALLDEYYEKYCIEDFAEASRCLLNEILIRSCYLSRIVPETAGSALISHIIACIDRHLTESIDAEFIAEQMNFSKNYIQNRFSREMGIGLYQYILRKKIYAANKDMQSGLSPGEAAEKYCFSNYSSFFRNFVKIFGHSPGEISGRTVQK